MLTETKVLEVFNRTFERLVKELAPTGTKNRVLKMKPEAKKIFMEELRK